MAGISAQQYFFPLNFYGIGSQFPQSGNPQTSTSGANSNANGSHTIAKVQKPFSEQAVAPLIDNDLHFAFEPFLRKEYQFGIDPNRPICKKFLQGKCELGNACPDRHVQPSTPNRVVCKHWLRGLCKKGDACEFLHEYNLRKMPECTFFARNGFCTQSPDCLYLHIDPQSRIPSCQNYERGFCRLGPDCPKRHIRRTMCEFYLTGFCPKGRECSNVHPKWTYSESIRIRAKGEKIRHDPMMELESGQGYSADNEDVIKVLR
ncbi:hypothetical protein V1517DRAFT_270654 [Lipomyces orientalis]|uniref:Uncharacterized protein n=1 Tax=Lipomyces orientalis TaxID=1233043 RepID=A0ACC3TUW7_9ASCO